MTWPAVIERAFLIAAFLVAVAPSSFSQRLQLTPHVHAGQILLYRIDFRNSRNMQTQSSVASPQLPPSSDVNASGLLQVEIVATGAGRPAYQDLLFRARSAQFCGNPFAIPRSASLRIRRPRQIGGSVDRSERFRLSNKRTRSAFPRTAIRVERLARTIHFRHDFSETRHSLRSKMANLRAGNESVSNCRIILDEKISIRSR